MLRRYALSLLLLASIAPAVVSAKAVVPRASKEILEEEYEYEETVTASQEVTEIVTEEPMDLEPIVDEPKVGDCDRLRDVLNFRKPNNYVSEWAAFWRLSGFNPRSNTGSSGSVMNNLGLRYKVPDKWGEYYQLAYELSYNFWDGGTADIQMAEFAVEVFACGSPLFRMKHHPYYGIGIGNAEVDRLVGATYNVNTLSVFGGIEFPGRRVTWDVFAKYIMAPIQESDPPAAAGVLNDYNMDDLQLGLGVVYTFGHGR